ncbi:14 kDa phosphohistidine phosphatase-like [Agrilus planipennis]|uniref:14 kDa phosphohistidine phosphatase-like n=1 Tax=Agrilus planipennis TaxID=224129 RepID=A0A1W4WJ16_AGRPL|nr:14 kDa phosphohistidine phosphatase-like [Agrilus planipennis]
MTSSVPEVDIEPSGVFKYILLKLTISDQGKNEEKTLVRGYAKCNYHVDVNDLVTDELNKLKEKGSFNEWKTQVLGGGRIIHDPANKNIKVYGYSQAYGKAEHAVTVELLKKVYPDYDISWSDEGY